MTQTNQLLLIDLSGIAHQLWHVSGSEPDPNFVSVQTVARVHALASNHPYAAVCCDNGKSFRKDIDPTYKANRDTENRAPLHHQMTLACETLKRDGFPVWSVKGFEADDLIATATSEALKIDGATVLIASADKDLLQLVNDRVQQKKTSNDATLMDVDAVRDKFKVTPEQMRDYLCLVGDASDNIKGASNIGPKTASELLQRFGTLADVFKAVFVAIPYEESKAIYTAYANAGEQGWKKIKREIEPRVPVTPAVFLSLVEFFPRHLAVSELISLRTDAPIPFHEIAVERTAPPMEETPAMEGFVEETPADVAAGEQRKAARMDNVVQQGEHRQTPKYEPQLAATSDEPKVAGSTPAVVHQPSVVYSGPVDFSQQLEPRSMEEAKTLARYAFASRMFSAYGTEQAVLMVLMAGRELGLSAMASLRGFHLVEGRATLSADLIRALIIRSGKAKYFRPTERTATRATWETQRGDDPPISLTFTIEEAQQAGVVKNGSGWMKYPADMLTARASAKLARLVYSDIVFNLYDPSEIG